MSGKAYIAVRPGQDDAIHVICRPCGLDQPSPRWHAALDEARLHNLENHGTP